MGMEKGWVFAFVCFCLVSVGVCCNSSSFPKGCTSSNSFNDQIGHNFCKCMNYSGEVLKKSNLVKEKSIFSKEDTVILDVEETENLGVSNTLFFRKYFDLIPAWNTKGIDGVSKKCKLQSDIYLKDLKNMKLWALKMYDSTGKISTSILNGNIHQYGDFDQCLRVERNDKYANIQGKYCLVSFQIKITGQLSNNMKNIYDLVHSNHIFRSELDDPGHRIPRFSSMTWGMCVPDGCSANDVQIMMQRIMNDYVDLNTTSVAVSMDPSMCQMKNRFFKSNASIIVSLIFIAIFGLVLYTTLCDISTVPLKNEILMSFSLKRTFKSLFSLKRAEGDIKAIHGIRCLNALMLLISHKSMAIFFIPHLNRTELAEKFSNPWSVVGRVASLYTDPFIMFSGLLTYNSIMNRIDKNKNVSIVEEYIGRLFRLIPTMSALILFCTWILPEIGSGPQWPLVVDHHAEVCKKYWWRNYLFIHNYFGFENVCLTHTHHIGIDTQLFFIGVPFILWMGMNKRFEKKAMYILLACATLTTFFKFYVSYSMNLANFVYFGSSLKQLFRTANHLYILPVHRFAVYAMGILLAKILRHPPNINLTPKRLIIGWILSAASFCVAFFGPSGMGRQDYKYNAFHNSLFAAFGPIAWCYSFAWIIFTSHHGYNSVLGNAFSSKIFVVWTRLSYAVYLAQFPVFFYNIGVVRTVKFFSYFSDVFDIPEYVFILISSIIFTLIFDLPFQNIKKIIFRKKDTTIKKIEKSD